MARPLRIEFPGGLYHVTSRGDRGEAIYEDGADRSRFLEVLGEVVEGWNWVCHSFCLMTSHYHLVVQTPDGNLSKGGSEDTHCSTTKSVEIDARSR